MGSIGAVMTVGIILHWGHGFRANGRARTTTPPDCFVAALLAMTGGREFVAPPDCHACPDESGLARNDDGGCVG